MTNLSIAARGFLIVCLVSWNVRHVSQGEYVAAFFTGGAIGVAWWLNAGLAGQAKKDRRSAISYGLGSAVGTVCGLWLGR